MKKRGRALALLLATVLTVSSVPGTVLAAEGIRPQDGTTKEQPFLSGTGGSSQFRIPCLVSLDDGTIVAGCDARWNTRRRRWSGYDRVPVNRQRKNMALYFCKLSRR